MPSPECRLRSRLARAAQIGALLGLVCVSASCLVTDKVSYDRANAPAQLTKLDPKDFTPVTLNCSERDMGPSTEWMSFSVAVRDQDVEDQLQARILVNGDSIATEKLPVTGREDRDDFSYCLQKDDLQAQCLHVEVIVSNAFSDIQAAEDPYDTEDSLDYAHVEWWLLGPSENFAEVGVSACQQMQQEEL